MENIKFIKFLISILIFNFTFFIFSGNALAYELGPHAFLTDEIIKFYNQNFSAQRISDELKDYLIDGSRREDDPPRWMNHYYDPVYNRGLSYDPAIDPLINLGTWQKSKEWAQDNENQNSLTYKVSATIASILTAIQQKKIDAISTETDFTWQRAIKFYVDGEREKAMFLLGHIIHLTEDKAVPDHTRNDAHPGDSPYEKYTAQFSLNNPDKNLEKRLIGKIPIILNNLDSYFDDLGKYSNNNFYSKDTIGMQSGYVLPEPDYFEILEDGRSYGMHIEKEFGDYPIVMGRGLLEVKREELLNRPLIMSAYWSRLSTKSVQYGAGVINLFFQEVEKAKNDPNFAKTKEKSFFGQLVDSTKSFFAQIGGFFSVSSDNNQNFQPADEISLNQTENQNNILPTSISPSQNTNQIQNINQTQNAEQTQNNRQQLLVQIQNQLDLIKIQAEQLAQEANQPQIAFSGSGGGAPVILSATGGGTSTSENSTTENQQTENQNSQQNSTSTQEISGQNATSTPITANHIVISEIQIEGSNPDDEFIELYNPTDQIILLADYSIQYLSGKATSTEKIGNTKKNFKNDAQIAANSFYLLLNNSATSTLLEKSDMTYSFSLSGNQNGALVFLVKSNKPISNPNDENIVDYIAYGNVALESISTTTMPEAGQSLERRANQNENCVSSYGENEFLGNSCDSDSPADFEVRQTPNPQNSQSFPEPRTNPTTPQNFTIQYSSSTMNLNLRWDVSQDYSGATSTITYKITDRRS